jgi:ankyrin repeat protein
VARDKAIADSRSALFLTDPEVDLATLITAKGSRVPGTCEWIKEESCYQQWLEGNVPLLWICGGPGKGKTMLSVFLVEELKKKQRVMHYFCTNEDGRRNNAAAVLRSLLWQITSVHPDLAHHLLTHCGTGVSDAAASLSSEETLWMIFTKICRDPRVSKLVFILDGLDECDEESRDCLASKLHDPRSDSDAQRTYPPRIIVVSREIANLRLCRKIRLDPDYDGKIGKDVECVVSERVKKLWALGGFDEKHRRQVEATLLGKSEGTFLWVGFAIAELLTKQTLLEVEQCLDDLPAGLPAFYGRMMRQIAVRNVETSKIAKLLRWTTLSARPMSVSELAAAIPCTDTELRSAQEVVRDLVTLCRPFLMIQPRAQLGREVSTSEESAHVDLYANLSQEEKRVDDRNQTVTLIHQSARDFMDNCEMPTEFHFQREQVHFDIAWKCIDLIQFWAEVDLWRPFDLFRTPLDTGLIPSMLRSGSMFGYALDHWPAHARKASAIAKPLLKHPSRFFGKSSRVRLWWTQHHHFLPNSPPDSNELYISVCTGFVPWIEKILADEWRWRPGVIFANSRDEILATALLHAAQRGHGAAMQTLLEHGANPGFAIKDIDWRNKNKLPGIHIFAASGNEMAVRICIKHGTTLVAAGDRQETPLHLAATGGHDGVVQLLLEAGVNVEAKDSDLETALIKAARHNQGAVVRMLLGRGAEVGTKNRDRKSALHLAAAKGHEHVMKLLLDHDASFDVIAALYFAASPRYVAHARLNDHRVPIDNKDYRMREANHNAGREGHDAILQAPVTQAAGEIAIATASEPKGGQEIMNAITSGFMQDERIRRVVQLCCESEADINAVDATSSTALHLGVANSWTYSMPATKRPGEDKWQIPLVQALLDHGAKVDAEDDFEWTALHVAATNGAWSVVQLLLDRGAQIDAETDDGRTALHLAARNGARPVTQLLIDRGAQIDAEDYEGLTPLHHAALNGDRSVVQLLLNCGLSINAKGREGQTPLHLVTDQPFDNTKTVTLLLDLSANIDCVDEKGRTSLHCAAGKDDTDSVRLLLARGAQVDARDHAQRTPLHLAAESLRWSENTLRVLLDYGADVNARDDVDRTPLDYMELMKKKFYSQLLRDRGAVESRGTGVIGGLKRFVVGL